MIQLLLEGGVFSEDNLLELLEQCVRVHQQGAGRQQITLGKGDVADKKTLDNLLTNECDKLLLDLGIKVWRSRELPTALLFRARVS